MSVVGYYPGCSLEGGGIELDLSVKALAAAAGVELREIEDWNCCGASAAHSLNHDLAVALPYRTLALAQRQGLAEVLAPCASCFSRMKGTVVRLKRNPELVAKMREITGQEYAPTTVILNIVEFVNRLLAEGLAAKLTAPLGGWRAVAYYGCLLSRGEGIVEGDDPENPVGMEAAIRAAGCEVMPWNFATECCGGGFSMSKTEAVLGLSSAILTEAKEAGAQIIVTGCPMCHSNLDMRQRTMNASGLGPHNMPVLYLTELLGLAAGMAPKSLGLNRHFVDAMCVVPRSK
jgi:heterodisulfide reductase subunit B